MWQAWYPDLDSRLQTHFDLHNTTSTLIDFVWEMISIKDFQWGIVECELLRVSWDNIKIRLADGRETIIHFTEEGRKKYPIQFIYRLNTREEIYHHTSPESDELTLGELDIERIISEETVYRERILSSIE